MRGGVAATNPERRRRRQAAATAVSAAAFDNVTPRRQRALGAPDDLTDARRKHSPGACQCVDHMELRPRSASGDGVCMLGGIMLVSPTSIRTAPPDDAIVTVYGECACTTAFVANSVTTSATSSIRSVPARASSVCKTNGGMRWRPPLMRRIAGSIGHAAPHLSRRCASSRFG